MKLKEPLIEMKGITKRFPGVLANDSVNLTLYPGEVHALLGENGAGKSTLMNVLTGIYFPNEGSIRYKGRGVILNSPRDAVKLGIGMVHQHFKLVETLSVAENIFLYTGQCGFFLNPQKMNKKIEEYAEQFQLYVAPEAKVSQLSIGEQQRVEILKLLASGADLLILDEPTAVLTPQESDSLFSALAHMAQLGKSVLVITHKMGEVMRCADRITVLRGGRFIATTLRSETSVEELTMLTIGHGITPARRNPLKDVGPRRSVVLLDKVCAQNDRGMPALKDISLSIHEGEILGIAGVSGNGQRELAEVMSGLRKITSGSMTLSGKDASGLTPKQAINRGVAYIPDDRTGVGLVGRMDMPQNLILKDYDRPGLSRHGILRKIKAQERAKDLAERFNIKNAGIHMPVGYMSGGNLQKLLVAREILNDPKLIVAAYPVHGLDVGAIDAIHSMLLEQREKGIAILLISEDLDELFELSDRIAVLFGGQIIDTLKTEDTTLGAIGSLMVGVKEGKQGDA